MARRPLPSLGFLGLFGRSADLRQLDDGLRAADLHPRLVPEAVKLAAVNLIYDEAGAAPPADAYRDAAALLAYCMVGGEAFEDANGVEARELVERRIELALGREGDLDGRLILLAIHAKVIQPSVVEAFGLESTG